MKTGRTLSQLAAEIERQKTVKADYISDSRALTMTDDGRLDIAGKDIMDIGETAHDQFATKLGIPAKYYDRMRVEEPDLLAQNVNRWLHKSDDRRMVRTLDGRVRALLSDRYQRIDNHDVAAVALPVLAEVEGIRTVSTEITESRLYIKAVTSEIKHELTTKRVGDIVEAGVMISNSEIGLGRISVKPFAFFLWCLNGAVRDKMSMRAAHIGRKAEEVDIAALLSDDTKKLEDRAVLSKVKDVVRAAFDAEKFAQWMDQWQNAAQAKITGDVPKVIEAVAEKYTFSNEEQSSILKHLIEGGDLSMYGLANAVTRTAEDLPSYDRATIFETVGGSIIDLPPSQWKELTT